MGALIDRSNGRLIPLRAQHLLGASPLCGLVLAHTRASAVHALLMWHEDVWQLKDLASTNGSFLDGVRVPPGRWTRLWEGAGLSFGSAEVSHSLASAVAPEVTATLERPERVVRAEGGLIALPDADEPDAVVLQNAQGEWVVERQQQVELVRDGQILHVGAQRWRLYLAGSSQQTLRDDQRVLTLNELRLRFDVSYDGDRVNLTLLSPDGAERRLEPRAHHGLLLTLVRRWAQDLAAGVPPLDAGWMSMDELARELPASERLAAWGRINLHVYKARRELAELGVESAGTLIERRRGQELLRFGGAQAQIHDADGALYGDTHG